uniref:polynucleotide adenylyltransferase n=1 Tax=Globodera rostochiensis TaxID=31243 RepID=A0A914HP94_GLORO
MTVLEFLRPIELQIEAIVGEYANASEYALFLSDDRQDNLLRNSLVEEKGAKAKLQDFYSGKDFYGIEASKEMIWANVLVNMEKKFPALTQMLRDDLTNEQIQQIQIKNYLRFLNRQSETIVWVRAQFLIDILPFYQWFKTQENNEANSLYEKELIEQNLNLMELSMDSMSVKHCEEEIENLKSYIIKLFKYAINCLLPNEHSPIDKHVKILGELLESGEFSKQLKEIYVDEQRINILLGPDESLKIEILSKARSLEEQNSKTMVETSNAHKKPWEAEPDFDEANELIDVYQKMLLATKKISDSENICLMIGFLGHLTGNGTLRENEKWATFIDAFIEETQFLNIIYENVTTAKDKNDWVKPQCSERRISNSVILYLKRARTQEQMHMRVIHVLFLEFPNFLKTVALNGLNFTKMNEFNEIIGENELLNFYKRHLEPDGHKHDSFDANKIAVLLKFLTAIAFRDEQALLDWIEFGQNLLTTSVAPKRQEDVKLMTSKDTINDQLTTTIGDNLVAKAELCAMLKIQEIFAEKFPTARMLCPLLHYIDYLEKTLDNSKQSWQIPFKSNEHLSFFISHIEKCAENDELLHILREKRGAMFELRILLGGESNMKNLWGMPKVRSKLHNQNFFANKMRLVEHYKNFLLLDDDAANAADVRLHERFAADVFVWSSWVEADRPRQCLAVQKMLDELFLHFRIFYDAYKITSEVQLAICTLRAAIPALKKLLDLHFIEFMKLLNGEYEDGRLQEAFAIILNDLTSNKKKDQFKHNLSEEFAKIGSFKVFYNNAFLCERFGAERFDKVKLEWKNMVQQIELDGELYDKYIPKNEQTNFIGANFPILSQQINLSDDNLETFLEEMIRNNIPEDAKIGQQITEELNEIRSIVEEWSNGIARLYISGSFLLGTRTIGSDIDLLCLAPGKIIKPMHFFDAENIFCKENECSTEATNSLYCQLCKNKNVKSLVKTPFGSVFLIKFEMLRALSSYRSTLYIANLFQENCVSSVNSLLANRGDVVQKKDKLENKKSKSFRIIILFLKIWAINNHIYSTAYGYLNGSTLTIMVAKIMLLYPTASLPFLLEKFFVFYLARPIRVPVQLNKLRLEENLSADENPDPFFVRKPDEQEMPVYMPMFPEQNVAKSVTHCAVRIIRNEMINAFNKINVMNAENLNNLLTSAIPFAEKYETFILVNCVSKQNDRGERFCQFVAGRIRLQIVFDIDLKGNNKTETQLYNGIYQKNCAFHETLSKLSFSFRPNHCNFWLIGIRSDESKETLTNNLNKFDLKIKCDYLKYNYPTTTDNVKELCYGKEPSEIEEQCKKLGIDLKSIIVSREELSDNKITNGH